MFLCRPDRRQYSGDIANDSGLTRMLYSFGESIQHHPMKIMTRTMGMPLCEVQNGFQQGDTVEWLCYYDDVTLYEELKINNSTQRCSPCRDLHLCFSTLHHYGTTGNDSAGVDSKCC